MPKSAEKLKAPFMHAQYLNGKQIAKTMIKLYCSGPRTNVSSNRIKSTSQFKNSYQLFPHRCKQGRTEWFDCPLGCLKKTLFWI